MDARINVKAKKRAALRMQQWIASAPSRHRHLFIMKKRRIIPTKRLLTWAKWFEGARRHVDLTLLDGGVKVSTVFLGLDHGFYGLDGQRPTLFETMIFGGPLAGEQWRYGTWEEAEVGHQKAVYLATDVTDADREETEQKQLGA